VTFLLAVDPAVAYDRIESRGYDHETMDYLRAATGAYRALPEYRDFVVIDANRSPDEVAAQIHAHLAAWLPSELLSTGALAAPAGPSPAGPAEPSPAGPSPAGPSPAGPSPAGPSPAGPSPAGPSPRRDAHPARPRPACQSPAGTHVRLPV
jgi:dTMP kinase